MLRLTFLLVPLLAACSDAPTYVTAAHIKAGTEICAPLGGLQNLTATTDYLNCGYKCLRRAPAATGTCEDGTTFSRRVGDYK